MRLHARITARASIRPEGGSFSSLAFGTFESGVEGTCFPSDIGILRVPGGNEDAKPRQPERWKTFEKARSGIPARGRNSGITAGLLARGSTLIRLAFPVIRVTSGARCADGSPLTVAESAPALPPRAAHRIPSCTNRHDW